MVIIGDAFRKPLPKIINFEQTHKTRRINNVISSK